MIELRPIQAAASDKNAIAQLLIEADLPIDGLDEFIDGFMVIKDDKGSLAATAGSEWYNEIGLLRSVVVDPAFRGAGLGRIIVSELIDQARNEGVKQLILLTTTARDFFEKQFGFYEIPRHAYDDILRDSPGWNFPMCSSAVAMQKDLIV